MEDGSVRGAEQIKFIHKQLLKIQNPTLLDVGAHSGSYCLLPSVNKTMRCYAFEPSPIVFPVLADNVKLNNLDVKIYNLALSDFMGSLKLKIPKDNPGSGGATVGENPLRFDEYFEEGVSVITMDSWMKQESVEKVDIIKIDTEGCEKFVLKGGEKTIKKYRPGILMEVNPTNTRAFGYDSSELMDLLASWGYLITRSFGEDIYLEYHGPLTRSILKLRRWVSNLIRRSFPELHNLFTTILRMFSKMINRNS